MILFLGMVIGLGACESGSNENKPGERRPVGPFSSIEAGPVRYSTQEGVFLAEVTVTIRDLQYQPFQGVRVQLDLSDGGATADATELVTDELGQVVFSLRNHHIEVMTVSAIASTGSAEDPGTTVTVDTPAILAFSAAVSLEPVGGAVYEPGLGRFQFRLTLTETAGVVDGGDLTCLPPADELSMDPGQMTTDASGQAVFTVTATTAGAYELSFGLAGIVEPLRAPVSLPGPSIGGSIERKMAYDTQMVPTRVGIFALQVSEGAPVILGEFAGIPVYTGYNNTFDYTLTLPFAPPPAYLLPTADGLRVGSFVAALYYDANRNDRWDPDEFIGAAHRIPGSLVYFAPDTDPAPPVAGWSFVRDFGLDPEVLPWDELAERQDMDITTAPVHGPVVRGTFSGDVPGSLRVGFAIVDGPQLESILEAGADPWSLPFDPASSHQVLNMGIIDNAFEGTLDYPMTGLDAATVEAWSVTHEIKPGVSITYLPVMAFAYVDVDDDRKLSAGDTLAGIALAPDGVRWTFSYVLDMPRELGFMSPGSLFLHAGYNWWSAPADSTDDFLDATRYREWNVSIPMMPRPCGLAL
ncbi:MAG: hypothetical protein CVU59_04055 [Deltaproteobacteria bacterium HGW-Deltaproteobacteria-17]|nr:MAG: hypothetical protein CVU59_04055 [Deltaproteobacteria bacterium HGW-Deltaproteobacteria-17]